MRRSGALATETTMTMELVNSDLDMLPNDVLSGLIDRNLRAIGGVSYSPEEQAFAEAIRKTLPLENTLPLGSQEGVRPPDEPFGLGSTDAGDVSWIGPTGWFSWPRRRCLVYRITVGRPRRARAARSAAKA